MGAVAGKRGDDRSQRKVGYAFERFFQYLVQAVPGSGGQISILLIDGGRTDQQISVGRRCHQNTFSEFSR